jgi:K+-sensing histidine kinase KdpD
MERHPNEIEAQNSILARLLEVSLNLNSNLELTPLLNYIMESAKDILHSQAASILLYDDKLDQLRFVASNSPDTDFNQMAAIPVPTEGSIAGQVVREGRPLVIQDALSDARVYKPVGDRIGFVTTSLLAVPMTIKGKVVGVLEGVNKQDGSWTTDDANHLSILASHAAVALQNAQQAEELRHAYDELNQLDKLKNDFIAIASHELRTPLGVILGYASFLQEEAEGEAGEHAAMVLNSALHLRNLIEDMVNLQYLQRGDTDLICEPIPVAALVEAALHDVEETFSAKGHQLDLHLPPETIMVSADRVRLSMAITNILNNAIKFTPNNGKIGIDVELRPREVVVKIADSGAGIPEDQLERIFEKFYQIADHMTRKHNGMGIGLAICRAVVEAHGGRVWAESAGIGQGSMFFVVLPILTN